MLNVNILKSFLKDILTPDWHNTKYERERAKMGRSAKLASLTSIKGNQWLLLK